MSLQPLSHSAVAKYMKNMTIIMQQQAGPPLLSDDDESSSSIYAIYLLPIGRSPCFCFYLSISQNSTRNQWGRESIQVGQIVSGVLKIKIIKTVFGQGR